MTIENIKVLALQQEIRKHEALFKRYSNKSKKVWETFRDLDFDFAREESNKWDRRSFMESNKVATMIEVARLLGITCARNSSGHWSLEV